MVTEMVKGKSLEDALKISNKAVAEALGGCRRLKCIALSSLKSVELGY